MSKPPFEVWITPECLERLNFYATEALPTEIGGYAKIEEMDGAVFVTDIFIPKQDATGGTFNITPEMDNEFMQVMMKSGRRKELALWKSIVHSHPVGMGPSMSGTDVEAIQRRADDTECYSLIISASRSADSDRMFMHYCANVFGKKMIWHDIPVQVGWSTQRIELADKLVNVAIAELGGDKLTVQDRKSIETILRDAVCEKFATSMEADRKVLRDQIKAEVAEKRSKPVYSGWKPAGLSSPPYRPATSLVPVGAPLSMDEQEYLGAADLEEDLKQVERLFSIGYDELDPVTERKVDKQAAKKARKLHKRRVMELNKTLRSKHGVGLGDLVVVDHTTVVSVDETDELATNPTEVDSFTLHNGLMSYEVGGEVFYADELIPVTQYEDIMGWNDNKVTA